MPAEAPAVPAEPARPAAPTAGPAPAGRFPGAVTAMVTARRAVRSAALWGYVFGASIASSAYGYTAAYPTVAARRAFAAVFAGNPGLAALNGPIRAIQTVAGYTVFKSFMFLMLVGSVWGLLTGTRLLRGEEDAGRWELLLSGRTTPRRAAAGALAGLAAGLAVLWVLTAVITVVAAALPKVDLPLGGALFYSLAAVTPAAVFLAAGALASQLAATRRQAVAWAGGALGVCYALRMAADSGIGVGWLRWLTPLGWTEALQPFTGPRPLVLVPLAALTAALAGLAVWLAGRRDLAAGLLPDRSSSRARTRLLTGPAGLAVRLARPGATGWAVGISASALLLGSLAKQGGRALAGSPRVATYLAKLGVHGSSAAAYLGFTFLMIAWVVAFAAVAQVAAIRSEESQGHLDHLLSSPVSRVRWLAGRLAVTVVTLAALGVLAGFLTWLAAASQGAAVGLPALLGAGVAAVPSALCAAGIAVLAFGVWPRGTAIVGYAVLTWSLLLQLLGGFIITSHWLLVTSVFHPVNDAPAVPPDWRGLAVVTLIAVAAAVAGGLALRQRDLAGE